MKSSYYHLPVYIISAFLFFGCENYNPIIPPEIPTVVTFDITDITGRSGTGGGEITDDGGSAVTGRGVVWSTNQQPTLSENDGYTTDGTGTGSFTSKITGLLPETQHYVRAYATNSEGTSYGNQVTFVTPEQETVTDIDGNVYPIVRIGNRWWMAENLRTTRYRTGDALLTNLNNEDWHDSTSGAYAIYPHTQVSGIDSDEEMVDAYGKLYNWYAVDDSRGLCPDNWQVPSDLEWRTLIQYLGGANMAGGKMKSTRTVPDPHPRWRSTNIGATNESDFSGLPGGYRVFYGPYYGVGSFGIWWSSTDDHFTGNAWYLYLSYLNSNAKRELIQKSYGYSVRCLME